VVAPVVPVGRGHGWHPGRTIRGWSRPALVLASGQGPQMTGVVDPVVPVAPVTPVHGFGGSGQRTTEVLAPVAPVAGTMHAHSIRTRVAAGSTVRAPDSQMTTHRRILWPRGWCSPTLQIA
jgi:hypothetical protein